MKFRYISAVGGFAPNLAQLREVMDGKSRFFRFLKIKIWKSPNLRVLCFVFQLSLTKSAIL